MLKQLERLAAAACAAILTATAAIAAPFPALPGSGRDSIPGHPGVIAEYIQIPGAAVAGTPGVLNTTRFLRIRTQSLTDFLPPAADFLVIAMPGFGGSALQWTEFGSQLVSKARLKRCGFHPCYGEVWIIDRRGNQLEDTAGIRDARVRHDPQTALSYYFGLSVLMQEAIPAGAPPFALGFDTIKPAGLFPAQLAPDQLIGASDSTFRALTPADVPYMSEWGFEAASADLDVLLKQIKGIARANNVFLAGHSQAGSYISLYAARMRSDGSLGQDSFAGLIFLDGGPSLGNSSPTAAQITSYLTGVDAIRSGAIPPFGTKFGSLVIGPGFGAESAVIGVYAEHDPAGETIFPAPNTPADPAGLPFLIGNFFETTGGQPPVGAGIRLTNRGLVGESVSPDPIPGTFLESAFVNALGTRTGNLNLSLPTNDPSVCAAAGPLGLEAPCPPNASILNNSEIYDWLDGGFNGQAGAAGPLSGWTAVQVGPNLVFSNGNLNPNPYPSKLLSSLNTYAYAPARTNIRPYSLSFAATGQHRINSGEANGLQWYQPARYESDLSFLPRFAKIQFSQDNVSYNIDRTKISVPCFVVQRFAPVANPYPLVTDYTDISGTGASQSPVAASLSPVPSTFNTAIYGHSDMIQADDSGAGSVTPGQPGASVITNPLIGWILARAKGVSLLPSSASLGVVDAR